MARARPAPRRTIEEKTIGYYMEFNGESEFFDKRVRYNLGGRFFTTDQFVAGPVTLNNGTSVSIIEVAHRQLVFGLPASFSAALNITEDIAAALQGRFGRPLRQSARHAAERHVQRSVGTGGDTG